MNSSLEEYQGPSVLVYNNSVFTADDFTSLRQLGYSQKLEQRMATGKFGLGFSSVCPLRLLSLKSLTRLCQSASC